MKLLVLLVVQWEKGGGGKMCSVEKHWKGLVDLQCAEIPKNWSNTDGHWGDLGWAGLTLLTLSQVPSAAHPCQLMALSSKAGERHCSALATCLHCLGSFKEFSDQVTAKMLIYFGVRPGHPSLLLPLEIIVQARGWEPLRRSIALSDN